MASLSARVGNPTVLWGRDRSQVEAMALARRNLRYLPDLELPDDLRYSAELDEAVRGVDLLLVVVPSHAFPALLAELHALRPDIAGLAWATKGFEPGSGRFLHDVAAETFPGLPLAVVTGPEVLPPLAGVVCQRISPVLASRPLHTPSVVVV